MKITVPQYAKSLLAATSGLAPAEVKNIVDNFVALVVKNRQENKLTEIVEEFSKVWDAEQGEVKAEVVSARELDATSKKMVAGYLQKRLAAKEVKLTEKISPEILGGFVLRYGDKIIDASLRNNLNNLKNKLSN